MCWCNHIFQIDATCLASLPLKCVLCSSYQPCALSVMFLEQVTSHIIRMKVAVFFAAICIFALVMPQAYAEEEEETAVREVRAGKGEWLCGFTLSDSVTLSFVDVWVCIPCRPDFKIVHAIKTRNHTKNTTHVYAYTHTFTNTNTLTSKQTMAYAW